MKKIYDGVIGMMQYAVDEDASKCSDDDEAAAPAPAVSPSPSSLSFKNMRLADLSAISETCQLENGITWTRSRNGSVQLYTETSCVFHAFLYNLDAVRSSRKLMDEGSAIWSVLNPRASLIQKALLARPYRETFHLPVTAVDVLILGTYMNRLNGMREAAIQDARMGTISTVPHRQIVVAPAEDEKEKDVPDIPRMLIPDIPRVMIPTHFGTHEDVVEFIQNTKDKKTHVTASLSEYETYLLYKSEVGAQAFYMSLLRLWHASIADTEFEQYGKRRLAQILNTSSKLPPFDPLASLRAYLDNRVFFSASDIVTVDESSIDQSNFMVPDGTPASPYVGVTPPEETILASAGVGFVPARSNGFTESLTDSHRFVNVVATVINEYEQRSQTLMLVASLQDRYINAIDEIVGEWERIFYEEEEGECPDAFHRVSHETMRNLSNMRKRLNMMMPELFRGPDK